MRPVLSILAAIGLALVVIAAARCASNRSSVPVRPPPQVAQ
ncbi:hypothetical protein [Methylobacterium currus]|nr:hypothetical protein [Methylobacterium currus]